MDDPTEDRLRTTFAVLRAAATEDGEAMRVLLDHSELEDLVTDLAAACLLFIGYATDNVAAHVDRMFVALGVEAEQ